MKCALQVMMKPHIFGTRTSAVITSLDFVNTVTGRDRSPRDWLDSYERLIEVGSLARLLPQDVLQRLAKEAREPAAAMKALARAKTFREQLFALLADIVVGRVPSKDVLAASGRLARGRRSLELRFEGGRVASTSVSKSISTRSRE